MRNAFNPFPSRNRRFPVPKGILHSFLKKAGVRTRLQRESSLRGLPPR